jgi:hypothetical protein
MEGGERSTSVRHPTPTSTERAHQCEIGTHSPETYHRLTPTTQTHLGPTVVDPPTVVVEAGLESIGGKREWKRIEQAHNSSDCTCSIVTIDFRVASIFKFQRPITQTYPNHVPFYLAYRHSRTPRLRKERSPTRDCPQHHC